MHSVGCVPPASVAVSTGVSASGSREVSASGSGRGVLVSGSGGCLPHPFGQTHTCENITLPKTLFAGGKNFFAALSRKIISFQLYYAVMLNRGYK